jgi:hypothetical protein
MERTAMSRKEFDRGAVFERGRRGALTLKDAAALLRVSFGRRSGCTGGSARKAQRGWYTGMSGGSRIMPVP